MDHRLDQAAKTLAEERTRGQTARRLWGLYLPAPPPPLDFDALAIDLAQGVSRREALSRLGGALVGALFASLGMEKAWAACPADQASCSSADLTICCPPGQGCINPIGLTCGPCTATSQCAAGQLCCSGVCQAPCGGQCCSGVCCNNTCSAAGSTCCSGAVGGACPAGQSCCFDQYCADLQSEVGNCGACGVACMSGQICSNGQCSTCPEGQTLCGGRCVNTQTDFFNCGQCRRPCFPVQGIPRVCCGGACCFNVPGVSGCCNNVCVNLFRDPNHCGSCGKVCPSGTCSEGECACSSPAHCQVGQFCDHGRCRPCMPTSQGCVCNASNPCPADSAGGRFVCTGLAGGAAIGFCERCEGANRCPAGQFCDRGRCRRCTPESEECVCNASSPCPADFSGGRFVCSGELCRPCGGARNCPAGQFCERESRRCRPCPAGKSPSGAPCVLDSVCCSGVCQGASRLRLGTCA